MADDQRSSMQPRDDTEVIIMPISWDVKKQDKKNWVMSISLMIIIGVILLIYSVGMALSGRTIFVKILALVMPWAAYIYFYRFMVFKETRIRKQFENQQANDYAIPSNKWWQIYHIDAVYPYVCHFFYGTKGIFLKVKKDVTQGKSSNVEYEHYETIAEVENYIAKEGLSFAYIDYMDNVGNDERMDKLMTNPNIGDNKALENVMLNIYSFLEENMRLNFSSFDVFLIYQRTDAATLKAKVDGVIGRLQDANYKAVNPMTQEEIRLLAKELFNLDNFSAVQAEKEVVSGHPTELIRPIQLIFENGKVETLNPTFAEESELKKKPKETSSSSETKTKAKAQGVRHIRFNHQTQSYGTAPQIVDLFNEADEFATSNLEDDTPSTANSDSASATNHSWDIFSDALPEEGPFDTVPSKSEDVFDLFSDEPTKSKQSADQSTSSDETFDIFN